MEIEFEKLVKKFEARKTSILLQHKARTLGTSAQALPSAAVALLTNQQVGGVDMALSHLNEDGFGIPCPLPFFLPLSAPPFFPSFLHQI